MDVVEVLWRFPVHDPLGLGWVHLYCLLFEYDTQEFYLLLFELTFFRFEIEVVLSKLLKDFVNFLSMGLNVVCGMNQNVVHIDR